MTLQTHHDIAAASRIAHLASQRYGQAWHGPALHANPILENLLAHKTVRSFLPQGLPEGTLETLVAAAQSAATSSNLQTWSVVAVEDPERKARLSALSAGQAHIAICPLFLVFLADLSRLDHLARESGGQAEALDYLEMYLVAAIDAALAAQNAVVAAESLGLGSCYIGAMRNNADEVHALLGLPEKCMALFGLCIGKPDPARPAAIKPRLAQNAVLHRESYDGTNQSLEMDAYDTVLAEFNAVQGQPGNWKSRALARTAHALSLQGRHRLKEWLRRFKFALK